MGLNLGDKAKGVIIGLGALGVVASAGAENLKPKGFDSIISEVKKATELLKKELPKNSSFENKKNYLDDLIISTAELGDKCEVDPKDMEEDIDFEIKACQKRLNALLKEIEADKAKSEADKAKSKAIEALRNVGT